MLGYRYVRSLYTYIYSKFALHSFNIRTYYTLLSPVSWKAFTCMYKIFVQYFTHKHTNRHSMFTSLCWLDSVKAFVTADVEHLFLWHTLSAYAHEFLSLHHNGYRGLHIRYMYNHIFSTYFSVIWLKQVQIFLIVQFCPTFYTLFFLIGFCT